MSAIQSMKMPINQNAIVELHYPEGDENCCEFMTTILRSIEPAPDEMQMNAYAASYINYFIPSMGAKAESVFNQLGYSVVNVRTNAERLGVAMLPGHAMPGPDLMAYLGQLILMLLKNFSEANYQRYMRARIRAMCARCCSDAQGITILLPLNKAFRIKGVLGSSHTYKRAITLGILQTANEETVIGQLCSYLASILEYTDMTSLAFIYETLILTRSPVLKDPTLKYQVIALANAYKAVCNSAHPKYFRLICTPAETRVTERSNYELIAALAQMIKAELTNTVDNFVTTRSMDDPNLVRLKQIHDQYMSDHEDVEIGASLNYLMSHHEADDFGTEEAAVQGGNQGRGDH